MADLVRYEVKDGVAVLTIDNPPVNALAPEVWGQIDEAVKRGVADPAAEALVLIGAGTTFIAGADIKAFELLKTPADSMARSAGTHALLKRMEDATKPLVAAIHGNALGGGLEVAQACHFRVAAKDAKVGQPEVMLGLIPGAGGTQRLPRLAGAALALTMCTDGKPVPAPKALAAGIIDQVVDGDLLSGAIAFAKGKAKAREIRKVREIVIGPDGVKAGLEACEAMRASLRKTAKGLRAPYASVDAIEAGLKLPFDQGSVREREIFADCVASTESKALRHLFFADREVAKIPDIPKDTPTRDIKRAAVVGAGTMGGGIAMNYANAGIPVLLKEVDQAALDRGLATIRKNYEVTMSKGKMTAEQVEKTMALITPTTSYDGFDQVDIVIEAVFENMDLKKATFADLGRVTRPDCILASNTSTLDIDEFAASSGRPAQVIGHHFFSPANVMKLLEIVRGRETSKEVIATSLKLAKKLGKVGGRRRQLLRVRGEPHARVLHARGVPAARGRRERRADRPRAHRLRPAGRPVRHAGHRRHRRRRAHPAVSEVDRQDRARKVRSRPVPDRLFEMGRYGQKTGAGWYRYEAPGSRNRMPDPLIEQLANEEAAEARHRRGGRSPTRRSSRASRRRSPTRARASSRRGSPSGRRHRRHLLSTASASRATAAGRCSTPTPSDCRRCLSRVNEYRARFGDYWEPAPLLERLVAEGRGFYSRAEGSGLRARTEASARST